MRRMLGTGLLTATCLLGARAAHAAEEAANVTKPLPQDPAKALAVLALVAVLVLGIGAALAVLRVLFPALARAVDDSVERTGGRGIVLLGLLPLVGGVLLARGVHALAVQPLEAAYLLVIGLPLALLTLAGAAGAVPHLGARLLAGPGPVRPITAALTGALALGLSAATWVLPPLGWSWAVLVLAWFLAVGLGLLAGRGERRGAAGPTRRATASPEETGPGSG